MNNAQINRACRALCERYRCKFVRRCPVVINGEIHQRITVEYGSDYGSLTATIQISNERLKEYER